MRLNFLLLSNCLLSSCQGTLTVKLFRGWNNSACQMRDGIELIRALSKIKAARLSECLEQRINTFMYKSKFWKRMSDSTHFDLTQLTARPAHLEEITLLAVNQESSSLKIRYNILNLSFRPMISYYGCRAKNIYVTEKIMDLIWKSA